MIDPDIDTLSIAHTSCKSTLAHSASMTLVFVLFLEQGSFLPWDLCMFPLSGILFLMVVLLDFFHFSVKITLLIALTDV